MYAIILSAAAVLCFGCVESAPLREGRPSADAPRVALEQDSILSIPGRTQGVAPRLVFTFAGDIMAHRPNYSMQDYSRIYADVRGILKSSELAFANLEFVIDPEREKSSYPRFNVHPDYVHAAVEAGFSVFSLANNHTTDFGPDGVQATARSTAAIAGRRYTPLVFSGIRREPGTDFSMETVRVGPYRIGFTAITGLLNDWSGSERVQFTFYDHQRSAFLSWLSGMRSELDLVVVSYHDGTEYVLEPNPRKQRYMQAMAQAGADIVWGHHPHVLQPVEILPVERRGEQRNAVVLYSTGNFVSSQTWFLSPDDYGRRRAYTGDSALYRVSICTRDGDLRLNAVEPVPITHLIAEDGAVVVRRMRELIRSGELNDDWQRYYEHRYSEIQPLLIGVRALEQSCR